jgi:hypothetical protein
MRTLPGSLPLCTTLLFSFMTTSYTSMTTRIFFSGEKFSSVVTHTRSRNVNPLSDGRGTVRLMRRVDWTWLSAAALGARGDHGLFGRRVNVKHVMTNLILVPVPIILSQ